MARIIIFFTAVILNTSTVFAQSFDGGIIAGLNGSQVDGDALSGYHKLGFLLGAFVSHDINDKFAGQMEMLFIQKGSQDLSGNFNRFRLSLNYIEVPFLVKYNFKDNIQFELGPSFGVLMSSRESDLYVDDLPHSTPFNKMEIAGHAGGYYLFNEKMAVNARFSHSLLPIRSHKGTSLYWQINSGQYNKLVSVTFRYRL